MKLSIISLVAWGCLGAAIPALATPSGIVKYYETSPVLDAVQDASYTVYNNSEECKDTYGLTYKYRKELVICVHKHDSVEELADTIRHESIHVAQKCKGAQLFTPESVFRLANDDQLNSLKHYPKDQWKDEIEAQVVAANSTDEHIVQIIKQYC